MLRITFLLLLVSLLIGCQLESRTTLHVVERATSEELVYLGSSDSSPGAMITFANEIFDSDNEVQLGTDNGYCIRTALPGTFECNATVILEGGQITFSGPHMLGGGEELATITGGTGIYEAAAGQVLIRPRGTMFDFIFEIVQ